MPVSFYERYVSITKREYESAVDRDVPVYILIDRSVHAEYATYRQNSGNPKTRYAHVDSVNVFQMIEEILAQPRNNPVHNFDKYADIESWLKEQWAGLFKEMISRRSAQAQLASLASQVTELANVNSTLKRYLEVVMSQVSEKKTAEEIIENEDQLLAKTRRLVISAKNKIIMELTQSHGIPLRTAYKIFTEAKGLEDLARRIASSGRGNNHAKIMLRYWRVNEAIVKELNEVRENLDMPPLAFIEKAAVPDDSGATERPARTTKRSSGRVKAPR